MKCGGSGLLRDLNNLEALLKTVRAAVRIPLTIKIRAGWDDKSIVAVEVARMAEQVGIEAIAVHPEFLTVCRDIRDKRIGIFAQCGRQ